MTYRLSIGPDGIKLSGYILHESYPKVVMIFGRVRIATNSRTNVNKAVFLISPPLKSQESAEKLYSELIYDVVNVDVIHAGKTQLQREESIKKFRIGKAMNLSGKDLESILFFRCISYSLRGCPTVRR